MPGKPSIWGSRNVCAVFRQALRAQRFSIKPFNTGAVATATTRPAERFIARSSDGGVFVVTVAQVVPPAK